MVVETTQAWPVRPLLLLLLIAVAVVVVQAQGAASTLSPEQVVEGWARRADRHPLVGKILRTDSGQVIDGIALAQGSSAGAITDALGLKGARFILLGEVHDNAQHHLLRAGLIDDLTENGRFGRNAHPPVVVEHLRADQAAALEEFRKLAREANPVPDAADIFRLVEWSKSGWPDAAMFRPLYDAMITARLRIVPGDVPRDRIRNLAREGIKVLDREDVTRLRLEEDFGHESLEALKAELHRSHCGMLPESALPPMAHAQRYRDVHLADALLREAPVLGAAILIAGNGHVRTDRGVPWHLRLRAPGKAIVSVMLIEIEDTRSDPQAYVPRDPQGRPVADAIIFTPRTVREDPCEKMRAHMQKKG